MARAFAFVFIQSVGTSDAFALSEVSSTSDTISKKPCVDRQLVTHELTARLIESDAVELRIEESIHDHRVAIDYDWIDPRTQKAKHRSIQIDRSQCDQAERLIAFSILSQINAEEESRCAPPDRRRVVLVARQKPASTDKVKPSSILAGLPIRARVGFDFGAELGLLPISFGARTRLHYDMDFAGILLGVDAQLRPAFPRLHFDHWTFLGTAGAGITAGYRLDIPPFSIVPMVGVYIGALSGIALGEVQPQLPILFDAAITPSIEFVLPLGFSIRPELRIPLVWHELQEPDSAFFAPRLSAGLSIGMRFDVWDNTQASD